MPFKDTPEGQTHSFGDGCGEPAHNNPMPTLIQKQRELFDKEFKYLYGDKFAYDTDYPKVKSFLTTCLIEHYEEDIRELEVRKNNAPVFLCQDGFSYDWLQADAYKYALDLAISLLQDKIKELRK